MHCPNCGEQAATEQKFCRSCGFDLKPVSQLFVGQSAEGADVNKWQKTVNRAISGCIGALGLFVLWVIVKITYEEFQNDPPGALVMVAFFGFLLIIGGLLLLKSLLKQKEAPNKLAEASATQLGQTTDKLLVEPSLEPAASVTEHTTRSLEGAQKQSK
jgi:hypothetical protein